MSSVYVPRFRGEERPTRRHKQGVALLRICMSRFATLQFVQRLTADLAGLHSRLASGGPVITGTGVIVDTETHLGPTGSSEGESPGPVGNQEGSGMVCGGLAGRGAEAEGCV